MAPGEPVINRRLPHQENWNDVTTARRRTQDSDTNAARNRNATAPQPGGRIRFDYTLNTTK